jgi:predicted lipid-binding transport protein (Tim44 family)
MRGIFGLVGLLMALVVVGLLVRQQMNTGRTSLPVVQQPETSAEAAQSGTNTVTLPAPGTAASSSGQIEQQFKQALDQAMQPRPQASDTP